MSNRLNSPNVLSLDAAMTMLKAAGYRISKPRAYTVEQRVNGKHLNAVGKPYSPQYDPNYRMKYKPRRYAPSSLPGLRPQHIDGISSAQWLRMCCEAQAEWNKRNPPCGPHFEENMI